MAKKSKSKKKKKQLKRHHFVNQPAQSDQLASSSAATAEKTGSATVTTETTAPTTTPSFTANKSAQKSQSKVAKFQAKDDELAEKTALMRSDAKTTFIVGGSIMAVLIVLWVLFEHTGLGEQVYHLINIS